MLIAVLQVVAPILAPPPIVQVATPAPPPRIVARAALHHEPATRPFTVHVDVQAEGRTLWSGPLRVARGSGSTIRHEQSEPPETSCGVDAGYLRIRSTGLSINLSVAHHGDGAEALSATVRWTKPSGAGCPHLGGTRTVELTDVVRLAPGATVTLSGDGGLTARLRRSGD
ncbi:hypothetical protein [Sphingomonas lenta]|uniref:Uncharacterized protein n=1 Tax=Sphingomonas lenta TaxID=1141887 RepID=A0A2A2SD16_9SPHN|nr:hypothetical protein [Sphingomonas lenta]PAX07090.1 hypothetical protein CKY28_13665 [Sphingomonas lenta]